MPNPYKRLSPKLILASWLLRRDIVRGFCINLTTRVVKSSLDEHDKPTGTFSSKRSSISSIRPETLLKVYLKCQCPIKGVARLSIIDVEGYPGCAYAQISDQGQQ